VYLEQHWFSGCFLFCKDRFLSMSLLPRFPYHRFSLHRYRIPTFGFLTPLEDNEQCISPSCMLLSTTPHLSGWRCGSGSSRGAWHAALMTKLQLAAKGILTLIFLRPISPTVPTRSQKQTVRLMKLMPENPHADLERVSLMGTPSRSYVSMRTRKMD
jgi:hypothetical protein